MYCLRSMISADIPLNQGCLEPIKVVCPENTILSLSPTAATVGCTIETSQKLADLIVWAFKAAAASQGTMNNVTFGYGGTDPATGKVKKGFGYYETIAGGAGAGPTWHGANGVHTHLKNTRIADLEIFKRRYPAILHEFLICKGSSGAGRFCGGDGVVREIEFRVPLQVSVLTDRRVTAPYGLEGGHEGQRGQNIWVRKCPVTGATRKTSLGPRKTSSFNAEDRLIILTPSRGSWGSPVDDEPQANDTTIESRVGSGYVQSTRSNGSLGLRNQIAAGN